MQVTVDQPEGTNVLRLDGRLTIERVNELKDAIKDALNRGGGVQIELEGVVEADLAFLQILCSAHKSARQMDIKLTVCNHDSAVLQTVVQEAGFARIMG